MVKLILTLIVLLTVQITYGQINYDFLKGGWKECVEYPHTDTLKMKPISVSDSVCKCSYQNGYYIRHIVTQYTFTDSNKVEVYTSHGSSPSSDAPRVDSSHMTTTIIRDTTINANGDITLTVTKIETPAVLQYRASSSANFEISRYRIKRRRNILLIDQGDRILAFSVLKLNKDELIMVAKNKARYR